MPRRTGVATSFRAFVRSLPPERAKGWTFFEQFKTGTTISPETWGELRRHLNNFGATHEELVAGRMVWREYLDTLRLQRRRLHA